jgi:hypothetical protein
LAIGDSRFCHYFADLPDSQTTGNYSLLDGEGRNFADLFADRFTPQVIRSKGQMGMLAQLVQKDASLQQFLKDFQQLIGI